jgi:tRNA (cytidine32/uridine32-2'-O)-methyltransferase
MSLNNIRIVMVNTTHPGNIGAAARAMKTMGLKHLYLVNPLEFPNPEAEARATQATDILENATICQSLEEAIHDCALVCGASARRRSITVPAITPREAVAMVKEVSLEHPVAILFGRERDGLHNEELNNCQRIITIPTDPDYGVLNVAAAVQIIAYELRMAIDTPIIPQGPNTDPKDNEATAAELAGLWQHLEETLVTTRFLDPENPRFVMQKLQRLFLRAIPTTREVLILRGILSSMQKKSPPQ